MDNDWLILVDANDRETGRKDKLSVHRDGDLHRAFSVFLFDSKGRMLLQQRAMGKYHSGGLWTNTCCSHPRPGENVKDAAVRRLKEEMGISEEELVHAFSFTYKASLDNGFTEHEFDHVFMGSSDAAPVADPAEVSACKYASLVDIERDLRDYPENYTAWFRLVFNRVKNMRENLSIA